MLDDSWNSALVCTELITKIAKMKSQYSSDKHGSDDSSDDDEPSG